MEKYNKLVAEHLAARKNRDRTASDVLGVLRGEVETALKGTCNDPTMEVEIAAKKMVKGLETFEENNELAKKEIKILQPYLPDTMSEYQIKTELDTLDLGSKPNVGAKMGAAMKHLQGRADGNDVKNVVLKYYN